MKQKITILSVLALVVLMPQFSKARLVPAWSLAQLFEKSDLVVMARAIETTDSKEKWEGHESVPQNTIFAAVETQFKTELLLKPALGGPPIGEIRLVHFDWRVVDKNQLMKTGNGHSFVTFQIKAQLVRANIQGGSTGITYDPVYLLFLHKRADGKYEPITGQYDASYSVREINSTSVGDFMSNLKQQ